MQREIHFPQISQIDSQICEICVYLICEICGNKTPLDATKKRD